FNSALLDDAAALHTTAFEKEAPRRRVLDALGSDVGLLTQARAQGLPSWWSSLLQPAEPPEAVGRLDGYEVVDVLGQGGMGMVFKAFDPGLKRWVAIKVLTPSLASNSLARLRFAREAQTAAAVRHEHVVTIHAVSEANGLPYFVMEYLAGGSLQDYLD